MRKVRAERGVDFAGMTIRKQAREVCSPMERSEIGISHANHVLSEVEGTPRRKVISAERRNLS
jgi:hypothetical protein